MRERKKQSARGSEIRPAARRADEQPEPGNREGDDLHALEARIEHLEALVQGLQDSVHRDSTRHDRRIAALEARTQPATLGKALSDDARERGL